MRELAADRRAGAIGCTQITEIKYTPGVILVGALPRGLELSTLYSVAVGNAAQERDAARQFVRRLSSPETRALRENAGFECRPAARGCQARPVIRADQVNWR